jgi:uncharacterized iron-regulated membrane protein
MDLLYMNSPYKSPQERDASLRARPRRNQNESATRAVILLNAAVAAIAGLFGTTGSALVTLIGFTVAAILTGWYLWTRRG